MLFLSSTFSSYKCIYCHFGDNLGIIYINDIPHLPKTSLLFLKKKEPIFTSAQGFHFVNDDVDVKLYTKCPISIMRLAVIEVQR